MSPGTSDRLRGTPEQDAAIDKPGELSPAHVRRILQAANHALQMAAHLREPRLEPLRIALLAADGELLASAQVRGREQSAFLCEQLRPLGFERREGSPGRGELVLVLVPAGNSSEGSALVRQPATELWPPAEAPVRWAPAPQRGADRRHR